MQRAIRSMRSLSLSLFMVPLISLLPHAGGVAVAVSIWDIFRFRPGITLDAFATAQRIISSGGTQNFFDGSRAAALSTGRPDGTGGDGQQSSHWKDDRITGEYIGVMDPTLANGQRDVITENDLAALRSFGYTGTGDQTTPDAPIISRASFNEAKLKLVGTGFSGQLATACAQMLSPSPSKPGALHSLTKLHTRQQSNS